MTGLMINIGWEWFLGIMGSLILIAWYTNGRFTKVETSMTWVEGAIKDLKLSFETSGKQPVFQMQSPVSLTSRGSSFLERSGLNVYIDKHFAADLEVCNKDYKMETAYDVQKAAFFYLDKYEFNADFERSLKEIAYQEGLEMSVVRRIGAIYLRDKCLEELGMEKKEIDAVKEEE